MDKPTIHVVTHILARPENTARVKSLLLELVEPSRQEAGCLQYYLHQNLAVPEEFLVMAEWASEEACEDHFSSPHIQEAFIEGAELLERPPETHRYHRLGE
jgi:quinol monooxygenase YgiN